MMMSDYEAYFRLDGELEEAPLIEPEQKVLVRRWLHRFVELKENAAAPAATGDSGQ